MATDLSSAIEVLNQYPEVESTSELKRILVDRLQKEDLLRELLVDMPIKVLDLRRMVKWHLLGADITTIGQLATKTTGEIYSATGIGKGTMIGIKEMLKKWGLGFEMTPDEIEANIIFPPELYDNIVRNIAPCSEYKSFFLNFHEETTVNKVLAIMAVILDKEPAPHV